MATKEIELDENGLEIKADNVLFLKSGLPYGYAYFANDKGWVDPAKTIDVKNDKGETESMNWIQWATRNGVVEKL